MCVRARASCSVNQHCWAIVFTLASSVYSLSPYVLKCGNFKTARKTHRLSKTFYKPICKRNVYVEHESFQFPQVQTFLFFFQFKMFPLGFMLMGNSMFTITFLIKNDRKNSDNQLNSVAIDH